MTAECFFQLNGERMATLVCRGFGTVSAFSGNRQHRNQPDSVAVPLNGPLPTGTYYIVDRESGGRLGWLRDYFEDSLAGTHRAGWFALYRNDGQIDDYTFIKGVKRGHFRLHPIGRFGISQGCITLPDVVQYYRLYKFLKSQKMETIPGTAIRYYGKVLVK
ncbi:DUF2778 domain-containing protein [Serratia ficaria]|uniref:DUF2778 domain-containing protein n=1 Tax=Serratia ficaria TaxID=61651 RepID=UPI0021C9845B|nr:DUF2778 domain-containing protein [Serratia ficaria]